jgi:hypothetical protein
LLGKCRGKNKTWQLFGIKSYSKGARKKNKKNKFKHELQFGMAMAKQLVPKLLTRCRKQ